MTEDLALYRPNVGVVLFHADGDAAGEDLFLVSNGHIAIPP